MRTVDETGVEVQNPDLELGYLRPGKVLIEHHDAIEYEPAQYEDVKVKEYDNGGVLMERRKTKDAVQPVEAWDEYENVNVYVKYTEEELGQKRQQEEELKQQQQEAQKQQEAKLKAQQQEQRMNLAVRTMSRMIMPMVDVSSSSDAAVAPLAPLFEEWDSNSKQYKKGDAFSYAVDGVQKYFRCSQAVTSTSVYKPGDPGTESLYYEIFIAPDGIEVWQTVKGEYNAPDKGDVVHYPDENGDLYESLVDDNAYSPDVYPQNWKNISQE